MTVDHSAEVFDLFCYGTLMVPSILVRVLDHDCARATFQDAVLPGHTRHCVKGADYPALLPASKLAHLDEDAAGYVHVSAGGDDEHSVRGTLVRGLSYADMAALDIFEGTEYSRSKVRVKTLGAPRAIDDLSAALADPAARAGVKAAPADSGESDAESGAEAEAEAWTYVWSERVDSLDPKIWSFADFLRDKAALWAGASKEYDEVDRYRALAQEPGAAEAREAMAARPHAAVGAGADGGDDEGPIAYQSVDGFDDFGKGMLKHWGFAETYVNLNHGSYGSVPKPVLSAMRTLADEIEARPCKFMRRTYMPMLVAVRAELAKLIGAETDEVVLVPNTTHGINNILTNMEWKAGDVILMYTTTYGAVGQTVKYICDTHPGVRLEVVDVTFPVPHAEIVARTEDVLARFNEPARLDYTGQPRATGKGAERVRAVVVDQIASQPGVAYPWEDIVRLARKYGALSIVDAAHAIGQQTIDVKRADCDFWVSNCHKWLMSHRGGSLVYVPRRNQQLIRTSFPTSAFYESTKYPIPGRAWTWVGQYEWTGTIDWAPFMTIKDALAFRRSIGGEDRIMGYCHALAVRGGRRIAKRWGTRVMENAEGSLTACMVNVELPAAPAPKDLADQLKQIKYIEDKMFEHDCFAPGLFHGGKWWVRFSAQVWNDLSDFDYVAGVYDEIVAGLRDGSYLTHDGNMNRLHEPEDVPAAADE